MTESFALYRKYRPQTFAEVKNQDHIVSVLSGAVARKAIPHALLFTGPRGTGKTTVARIFARAIGAADIDIYEIDAASNRGIDDIRELREAVGVSSFSSPYKVYIIDEVHMLTKEAFNALLKTLEEPPAHVVFILATTEEDKLLPTIISRCQVFRFRAPTREELAAIITDVAVAEGLTLSPGSARVMALAADGSYRDALGIVQKVMLASGDETLDEAEVAVVVGAPRSQSLRTLLEVLRSRDPAPALGELDALAAARVEPKFVIQLLLDRVRTILHLRHLPARRDELLSGYAADEATLLAECATEAASRLNAAALARLLTAAIETSSVPHSFIPLELAILELTARP
jgi:DNA polymerase-3 subunit gamma/tau